jgi:hypothetical protein
MAFTGVANSNPRFDSVTMAGPIYFNTTTGLTALAGGGQANATVLTGDTNVVETVATAADSVQLQAAVSGREVAVINASANSLAVFPGLGDKINALSINASFAVAAGKVGTFIATATGQWFCLLSA